MLIHLSVSFKRIKAIDDTYLSVFMTNYISAVFLIKVEINEWMIEWMNKWMKVFRFYYSLVLLISLLSFLLDYHFARLSLCLSFPSFLEMMAFWRNFFDFANTSTEDSDENKSFTDPSTLNLPFII